MNILTNVSSSPFLACQSLGSMQGIKFKTGFWFSVQKQSDSDSGSTPSAKKPHFDTLFESHQDSQKSPSPGFVSSADSEKKEAMGLVFLVSYSLLFHQYHLPSVGQVGTVLKCLDHWKNITFK